MKKNNSKYKWADRQFVLTLCCWVLLAFGPVVVPAQVIPDGKYLSRYDDGGVKERGFYRNGQKHRVWVFYLPNGVVDHKEKWTKGVLRWQVFYNAKGRVIKTIDEKGVVKTRSGCGC